MARAIKSTLIRALPFPATWLAVCKAALPPVSMCILLPTDSTLRGSIAVSHDLPSPGESGQQRHECCLPLQKLQLTTVL